jgi:methionine-rich copper-binding protein CopC
MSASLHRPLLTHTVGALVLAGVFLGGPASAHNSVEDRTPEPGAVVTSSPIGVSIATNDEFLDLSGEGRGFAIVGIDESGMFYGDGCVDIIEQRMVAELPLGQAGTYTIAYQFISADGHSLSESYTIEFAPGPDHSAAEGRAEAPVCGATAPPVAEPAPALEPADVPQQESERVGSPAVIAGIVAAVALGAVIVGAARTRKRT